MHFAGLSPGGLAPLTTPPRQSLRRRITRGRAAEIRFIRTRLFLQMSAAPRPSLGAPLSAGFSAWERLCTFQMAENSPVPLPPMEIAIQPSAAISAQRGRVLRRVLRAAIRLALETPRRALRR